MIRRIGAIVVGVVLAAAALTACVRDVANPAADWLAGRDGIAFAEVVSATSSAWSATGAVRGELEDGIDEATLDRLVDEVLDYMQRNQQVGFRLGTDRVDFVVGDDRAATGERRDAWREVVDAPGLAATLVTADQDGGIDVHARAMRPDADEVYAALAATGLPIRLGLFRDAAALEQNWREGYYSGDDPAASTLRWGGECEPEAAIADLALDLGTRDDVAGGWFALCEAFWIEIAEPERFATRVPELRAELDAIPEVAGFPVTMQTSSVDASFHVVAVTPTDPAVFGVLAVLEDPAAADSGLWELAADGSLTWTHYGIPAADLVARLAASPASTALSFIEVGGQASTVGGTIGELPALLEQADALDAAAESIGSVHLSALDATFTLTSPGLEHPDVAEAAGALRASGLWLGRTVVVRYLSMQAVLVDGVAQPLEGYTDPEVPQAFLDAWAATDSATTP